MLLGLPGAGKSTVGPLVAEALGRAFVDLDLEIERHERRSIAEIFAAHGEGAFRALERVRSAELLARGNAAIVLAPGGGWVEDPENRALMAASCVAVYLRVSPAVAVARMGTGTATRPLLAGDDPEKKLGELLARRESLYLQSQYTLSVDSMTPADVASSIVALA
ncbi:MAG: shikimate kinase [Gemmatimonadetes bacterium]|nr:shikimate kinase [Gemmatimonadota bacterium]